MTTAASRLRSRWRRRASRAFTVVLLLPLVAVIGGGAIASPAWASPSCWAGPAVVRGNLWLLGDGYQPSGSEVASRSFSYGRVGDQPFFGRWDSRSANSAPGVVRGATWYLRRTQSSGVADMTFTYGRVGDIHVVGDWNGDGVDTPGVVRGKTWYLRNSNTAGPANVTFTFNAPGVPTVFRLFAPTSNTQVAGPTEVATFDAGTWYVRSLQTTGPADYTVHYGQAGDFPLGGGDYIQSPDCTSPSVAVVRGNVWHLSSGSNTNNPDWVFSYGRAGDRFLSQHY